MLSLPMMNKIVVCPVSCLVVCCYFVKGHAGREKLVTLFSNGSWVAKTLFASVAAALVELGFAPLMQRKKSEFGVKMKSV